MPEATVPEATALEVTVAKVTVPEVTLCAHVGNDVVDLADPHIAGHHRWTRFVARVCAGDEARRVEAAADPHATLWALFAAKEAAFKVLAKLRPGIAFAPRRFRVDAALTTVSHGEVCLRVGVDVDAARVHAVAHSGMREPRWAVERLPAGQHESEAARQLAVRLAAEHLRTDPQGLTVSRATDERYYADLGPPRLLQHGRPLPLDLSLSHDGGWIACALLPSATASAEGSGA